MKIVLFALYAGLFLSTAHEVSSQDINLNEMVLLDRKYHLFVDSDEVLIYYNSGLTFEAHLEGLNDESSSIFSKHYQFSILNYTGEPSRNIFGDNMVAIFEGSTEAIIKSRLHHLLTSSYGVLGLVELGKPLVDNSVKPWANGQRKAAIGYYFNRSIFSEICSSFYVISPESFYLPEKPKYGTDRYSATFFISNTSEAEKCFDKLFIDLLGLRGLAVDIEASQQEIGDAIDALNQIENNHVFIEN